MINQPLLSYIKQQLQQNVSKEQIKNVLMSNGWDVSDVEEGFNAVSLQFPPIPHAPAPSPSPTPTINPTIQPATNIINPVVPPNLQSTPNYINPVVNQKKSNNSIKFIFIFLIILVLAGTGWFAYKYFILKVNSQEVISPVVNQEVNQTVPAQILSQENFNTKPTKLLDLSFYDLEKSQKLWSAMNQPVFERKGWFARLPLVKKGETQDKIVTGLANGSVLESVDGYYSAISPNNKYLAFEHWQKVDGATTSLQKKYSVEDVTTGKVVLETPLFTDVRAIHFDNNSAFYIVVREQQNIVWYKNNVQIMKTGVPAEQSTQDTEAWIKRTIFFDKQNLAMAGTMDGKTKIMLNGNVVTPDWKHPDDPILGIRILKSIADNKIFYVAIGKKNIAFFVNEKATMDNISFNENIVYLAPLFIGDADRLDYVADISSDGTRLAIIDTNGVTNSNIQQPIVRVLGEGNEISRKRYPKGSRIFDIKFSPDGGQLYYNVATDANDVNKRKEYIVINEIEQGPWRSIENFQWSGNGSYVYVATDEKFNNIIIKDGKTVRTIPSHLLKKDVFSLSPISEFSFKINPVNGKLFYILYNGTLIQSKAVYDEKESIAYTGTITEVNWGKSFFSNDGKHLIYLVTPTDTQDLGVRLVIDGEVHTVEGTFLGSWSSNEGGFSEDNKWFGVYVLKDNAVWWIPYDLEEIAKQ